MSDYETHMSRAKDKLSELDGCTLLGIRAVRTLVGGKLAITDKQLEPQTWEALNTVYNMLWEVAAAIDADEHPADHQPHEFTRYVGSDGREHEEY